RWSQHPKNNHRVAGRRVRAHKAGSTPWLPSSPGEPSVRPPARLTPKSRRGAALGVSPSTNSSEAPGALRPWDRFVPRQGHHPGAAGGRELCPALDDPAPLPLIVPIELKEFCMSIRPWSETAGALIDVAMGRAPADMLIRNGRWVNVHSGEILSGTDVAIKDGRFAAVGPDLCYTQGPATTVIEARDRYLVPGLCDGHMHVESGMVTVTEFCRAVIPHGTTSMFIDPHEIANVLGLGGVRLMHDEAVAMPINVYVQMPSCVPAAPGLENAGATIDEHDVAEAMGWPNIIGLGEMMNFPGVAHKDPRMLAEIAATQKANKTVGGHYASLDLGKMFRGYVAGGPADDHEGTRTEDAIARVRQGMRAMLRLGSAWYDVAPQIKAITEHGLDPRNFILCTDDRFATTLMTEGHIDHAVRYAIACGLNPITALQMVTINTATHFGLERELGSITPGRRADVIVTSDLATLPMELVLGRGAVLAENGVLIAEIAPYPYPD